MDLFAFGNSVVVEDEVVPIAAENKGGFVILADEIKEGAAVNISGGAIKDVGNGCMDGRPPVSKVV